MHGEPQLFVTRTGRLGVTETDVLDTGFPGKAKTEVGFESRTEAGPKKRGKHSSRAEKRALQRHGLERPLGVRGTQRDFLWSESNRGAEEGDSGVGGVSQGPWVQVKELVLISVLRLEAF